MLKFLKRFKKVQVQEITALSRNKVYVIELKNLIDQDLKDLHEWAENLQQSYNIKVIFITEGMKFVNIPEGYKIEKIKKN